MTTTCHPEASASATVDDRARAVALDVLNGQLSERDGVARLAELLSRSPVPDEIATRSYLAGKVEFGKRTDLAIRIRETFTAKMLPEPGCEPEVRIDFERIAQGSSFSSWVRSFGTLIANRSALRAMGRDAVATPQPSTSHWFDRPSAPSQRIADILRVQSLEDGLLGAMSGPSRPGVADRAKAAAICDLHDLPPVSPPRGNAHRQSIGTALTDPTHVATMLADLAAGRGSDSPLLDLFEDFPAPVLIGTSADAVRILALGAVAPVPHAPRARERELLTAAESTCRRAPKKARACATAWLERRCNVLPGLGEPVFKPDDQVAREDRKYHDAVRVMVAAGGTEMGSTAAEVDDWLADQLDNIEQAERSRRSDRGAERGA